MPKTNIREFDNTSSGVAVYENFTVVVPGLVNANNVEAYNEAADDNGIVELTSQSEFNTLVGTVPAGEISITAKAPNAVAISTDKMDEYKYYNTYADTLYTRDVCSATEVGYLVDYDELTDKYYEYTKIDVAETPYVQGTQYYTIKAGEEGRDAESGAANNHYGNQMAYELLGLGYTVLYKKLEAGSLSVLNEDDFWNCLKDKAIYDFRYVVTGLLANNTQANNCISKLAAYVNKTLDDYNPLEDGRGDCIALVDIGADNYSSTSSQATNINGIAAELTKLSEADKNTGIFAPYVIYGFEDAKYNNSVFPASFHYLACAAYAFGTLGYNEWYAVSGLQRGVSKYTVVGTGCKLGEAAVNYFQPRNDKNIDKAVNLIIPLRRTYYLMGNRTAARLPSFDAGKDLKASHFLNIRQLCTTIKKRVYLACNSFRYDPNSDILWTNFKDEIRPTLIAMQNDQGIQDYDFIKLISAKKALMSAKIRIVPIEAVEDFDIDLMLEDSLVGNGTILVGESEE